MYRLYHDLADWWPLISPPERYAEEAAYLGRVIGAEAHPASPVCTVLDLGSGGGHIASHLKRRFTMTLVDISPQMLGVSRRLNPECQHLRGDMRTMRLGRTFDAVLVHDAVDYVTTARDLRLVIETAYAHTRADGVALFVPDHLKDDFEPATAGGGGTDGLTRASFEVRYHDPDPADDWIAADYEFMLQQPDGTADVVRETHHLGAFTRATWLAELDRAGFAVTNPPRGGYPGQPAHLFIGRRGELPGQP